MPFELSRRLAAAPLLCDGAMGTLLYARGVSLDACFDVLNLNNPRVVQAIHADSIAAGADCIETNTYEGQDATGSSIGEPTSFCVGAALNPAAEDVGREIDRFHRKVAAGARWIQTQPAYDLEGLDCFLERAGGSPVPVLVGILPLHSARHAEFLHNEVPGITIPDAVRRRLREAGDGRFEVVAEVLNAIH